MKLDYPIALSVIVAVLAGCDSSQPQNQPAAKQRYQRFVPIQAESLMSEGIPWHGFFALDTRTGTLCRTVIYKDFPKGPSAWANDIPACAQVLAANPD